MCIRDSGTSIAEGLSSFTTRTNGTPDGGVVDIGYHYTRGLEIDKILYVQTDGNDGNTGLAPGSATALRSITKAIQLSGKRTLIYVAAGSYTNGVETFPLMISRKTVKIKGEGPGLTIIDATNANTRVMSILSAWGDNSIEGVKIRGGKLSAGDGGGLYVKDSILTLRNVEVSENRGIRNGGGVYAEYSRGIIYNACFKKNTAYIGSDGWSWGGGLLLNYGAWSIYNSYVSSNQASALSALGGGIYIVPGVHDLRNLVIADNKVMGSYTVQGLSLIHISEPTDS